MRAQPLGQGANIIFTTCDVDLATPVVQEAINKGVLAVAPCIGTDQMGPKRFGSKGALAFSFGNVAQDEGSAMAQWAWAKGWKTAGTATNTYLVYFKNVVQAFEARFKQLGGKIVGHENVRDRGEQRGRGRQPAQQRHGRRLRDGDRVRRAARLRERRALLRNNTPILNSWAGDGTYWVGKGVTNYYAVTFASAFGDDPSAAVNKLAKTVKAGTGGFVTGAAAIDGVVTAINRAGGSTNGAALAAQMVKFKKVPTISGLVSFSPTLHTVFGASNASSRLGHQGIGDGSVTAKVVPKI